MNRNIGISKETLDKVKLAKKYIQNRYTKMIQNENRNTQNWKKVLKSMENQNLTKNHQIYITEKICKQLSINKRLQREKDSLSNYQLYNIIGRGAFGEVRLAKNISTNQLVAIKRLQKKRLIQKKQLYNAYLQRDFLVQSKSTFLIQMKSAFQDKFYLYIAMQYAAGGDLLHLLIQKDIFSQQNTKFYIAEMISAIQEIHKMNYIHRDIKPDNILLDAQGHVKISDFGLGKYVQKKKQNRPTLTKIQKLNKHMTMKNRQSKTFSKVGTPDYISPQVLTQNIYDHSIDIWGIGVLMFQCLFGYPPFADQQPKQVCYKVINWKSYLQFPSDINITTSAKMLIFGMINEKNKRLSLQKIKQHQFFKGIDWNNLKSLKPPFVPKLSNQTDVGNFNTFEVHVPWTNQQKIRYMGHLKQKSTSLECNFKFVGFDYKKIEDDPLQQMKRSLGQNLQYKNRSKRQILKQKKRLKTQQSSKRDQKTILKNTLSFVKPCQKQNMMKKNKKIMFFKKQKNYKSSQSKSKNKNTSLKIYKPNVPNYNRS